MVSPTPTHHRTVAPSRSGILGAALDIVRAGHFVVPIAPGQKGPVEKGWSSWRLTVEELPEVFTGGAGVGVLTGLPEDPLADVDLDCPEAVAAAPFCLPPPLAIHGRPGNPRSHWWYRVEAAFKGRRYLDPVRRTAGGAQNGVTNGTQAPGAVLCELRGQGMQTVVPPTRHPSGETLAWEEGDLSAVVLEPTTTLDRLEASVARIAAAALIARYWPRGARHEAAMALAGGLLRAGWNADESVALLLAVAKAAGDEEFGDRVRAVEDTAARLLRGDEAVTGWTRLAELMGDVGPVVLRAIFAWLAISFAGGSVLEPQRHKGHKEEKDSLRGSSSCPSCLCGSTAAGFGAEPRPLVSFDLPPFPVGVLPKWLREMVETVSESTQTPPDVAGMLALAALALAAQRTLRVRVREGWEEPLSLWTLSTQESGSRKSAVFDLMTGPIRRLEADEAERLLPEIEAREQERKIAKASMEKWEKRAAEASGEKRSDAILEAREARELLRALPELHAPRLLCQDATEEAIGHLLRTHNGRIGVFDSEGGVFSLMAGRYGSKAQTAFETYLKGHTGEDLLLDRVTRGSFVVRQAAITLGLTVQPSVLAQMRDQPQFEERGLLARFLYACPPGRVGFREANPPPPSRRALARYDAGLRSLLSLPATGEPLTLTFSAEANAAVVAFDDWREPQLRPSGELHDIGSWACKLTGQLVRIAALLQVAEEPRDGWEQPLPLATWQRAEPFGAYLIAHAHAAYYRMRVAGPIEEARILLDWIERKRLATFSRHDLQRGMRANRFPTAASFDAPLALLVEHDYLRPLPDRPADRPSGAPGGCSEKYRFAVHPSLLESS